MDADREKKLIRNARNRGCKIENLITAVYSFLLQKADSEDDGAKPKSMETWLTDLQTFHNRFELAQKDPNERKRIETEAVNAHSVREACTYLRDSENDESARALLHVGEDVGLLYNGAAAQELLQNFAESCADPYRSALSWLATQNCARHAFAKSDEGYATLLAKSSKSNRFKDFSKIPEKKDAWLLHQNWKYWVIRYRLFVADYKKRNGVEPSEKYEFTFEDNEIAYELLREYLAAQGETSGNASQIVHQLRKY